MVRMVWHGCFVTVRITFEGLFASCVVGLSSWQVWCASFPRMDMSRQCGLHGRIWGCRNALRPPRRFSFALNILSFHTPLSFLSGSELLCVCAIDWISGSLAHFFLRYLILWQVFREPRSAKDVEKLLALYTDTVQVCTCWVVSPATLLQIMPSSGNVVGCELCPLQLCSREIAAHC